MVRLEFGVGRRRSAVVRNRVRNDVFDDALRHVVRQQNVPEVGGCSVTGQRSIVGSHKRKRSQTRVQKRDLFFAKTKSNLLLASAFSNVRL